VFEMTEKKTDKKVKGSLKEQELEKVTGGVLPSDKTSVQKPTDRKSSKTNWIPDTWMFHAH
jgi:hypothetical protein